MTKTFFISVLILFSALTASARPNISVYYSYATNPFGVKVLENGEPVCCVAPATILSYAKSPRAAYKNMRYITNFFESQFDQASYDNKNSPVKVIVNFAHFTLFPFLFPMKQNAAWVPGYNMMIVGAGGKELNGLENEIDVLAHEYTHAIVASTVNLNADGQSGALNESFADIFGEMAKQYAPGFSGKKWLFGRNVLSQKAKDAASQEPGRKAPVEALRDMLHPENSLKAQPSHMDKIPKELKKGCVPHEKLNDLCGVHKLNGIPNRAVALMVESLGWEKMKNILWTVMTYKLEKNAQFSDFAREMLNTCDVQLTRAECQAVSDSLHEVGL